MSNIALGGRGWAFYETIACGQGAAPGRHGASAHHTHMTNTLNTPVEVVERSYPLRVLTYRVRRGSGGAGKWRGGDGVVRIYKLLAPAELALAVNRVRTRPWGLEGGCPSKPARIEITLPDGTRVEPPPIAHLELPKGALVAVETPGGGGYGQPESGCSH
jgi:N-methylhydantoinase B